MMKNYIQQIIELFGHNEYSLATRRKVQRWLADDNHAEEKKEALHTLWQQAGEQKVPRGMQPVSYTHLDVYKRQTSIRGKLVSLNQLTIVLGILGAQIANWLIAEPIPADFTPADICASWNGQMGWRWMFWGAAFPAAVFLLLACFIPESPRWLAMKGKREKAWSVLSRIGGNRYAERELQMVEQTSASKSEGGLKLLFSRPFRKVCLLYTSGYE